MAKLVVTAPGEPAMHLDLPPGIHQVGRSPNAHFQINHPSISGLHCQIAVEPDGATITDLGSTNGTWLDGQRIQQQALRPGQRLRLGEVDAVFEPQAAPANGLHLASTPAVAEGADPPTAPPMRVRVAAEQPLEVPTANFYESIPGAFVYPLKHFGIVPLAIGSVLFMAFNMLPRLMIVAHALFVSGGYGRGMSLFFRAAFAGSFFGIGTIFNVLVTGYVFLFMQTIITASANGEERMPMYPPFESWWSDAVEPYFRLLGLLACCLAPAILCRSYLGPDFMGLTQFLGLLGFCYFSMALLAVSICDSLLAMTPQVVIPSICRIPAAYGVYCLLFLVLTGATMLTARWILEFPVLPSRNPFERDPFAIYRVLAVEFAFLYFTVVEMRLPGLLYLTGRKKLAWKL
jgi:hypothetical protein